MSHTIGFGRRARETYPVSSRGAGSPGASARVIWYPLGGGDVTTWQEVVTKINGRANIEILVGQVGATYTIPPHGLGQAWNVNGAFFVAPAIFNEVGTIITIQDGAQVRDLQVVENVIVKSLTTALPALIWSDPIAWLYMRGASSELRSSGTATMISLTDSGAFPTQVLLLYAEFQALLSNDGGKVITIDAAAPGPALALFLSNITGGLLSVDAIAGTTHAVIDPVTDGSQPAPIPAQPNFLGVFSFAAYGTVGGSGASDNRPTAAGLANLKDGTVYFDADNNREIIFNGDWSVLNQTFRGVGTGGVVGAGTVIASIAGVVLEPGGWARINAQGSFAITVADTDIVLELIVTRTSPVAAPVTYARSFSSIPSGKSGTVALNTAIQIGGGIGPGTFTFELVATAAGGTATVPAPSGQVYGADLVLTLSP